MDMEYNAIQINNWFATLQQVICICNFHYSLSLKGEVQAPLLMHCLQVSHSLPKKLSKNEVHVGRGKASNHRKYSPSDVKYLKALFILLIKPIKD